jgi:3-isopropylmalate dehydrogenase
VVRSQGKVRPEQGLLALRKGLNLFANLRPVTIHPALLDVSPLKPEVLRDTNIMVVRELTGGIYFGEKRRTEEFASDLCTYTVEKIQRVTRVAGRLAQGRRRASCRSTRRMCWKPRACGARQSSRC